MLLDGKVLLVMVLEGKVEDIRIQLGRCLVGWVGSRI